jgi:hypothetical protein
MRLIMRWAGHVECPRQDMHIELLCEIPISKSTRNIRMTWRWLYTGSVCRNRNLHWSVAAVLAISGVTASNSSTINFTYNKFAFCCLAHSYSSVRARRSRERIPMEAKFSAPVYAGPGAHPASCTIGTGYFLGVKSGRDVTLSPHPLLVPLVMKE